MAKKKKKMKRARDNKEDRLSDLPDCVLIHLLTFMGTRDAVRTCVLSTRWKGLWKRLPSLSLVSLPSQFRLAKHFYKFVSKVLALRDNEVTLHSLSFFRHGRTHADLLARVLTYAAENNIVLFKLHGSLDIDFPPCFLSSRTLTSLDLSFYKGNSYGPGLFPKSLNMTALRSLRVKYFEFCRGDSGLVEPFSSCINLKTLVLYCCVISDSRILCISNATLVSLTLHLSSYFYKETYKIMLSTPNLGYFAFSGAVAKPLSANKFSLLKEANIEWQTSHELPSSFILTKWWQMLANVRSLTISSRTLEVLSLIPGLLETESPSFGNLKSLIVEVKEFCPVPSGGVVEYLIRNSPFAIVTMIKSEAG